MNLKRIHLRVLSYEKVIRCVLIRVVNIKLKTVYVRFIDQNIWLNNNKGKMSWNYSLRQILRWIQKRDQIGCQKMLKLYGDDSSGFWVEAQERQLIINLNNYIYIKKCTRNRIKQNWLKKLDKIEIC